MVYAEEVRAMSEHFVKHINIEQYKCFSDFSSEGFKRVNLISGKNNVGKTALMEALFVNVHGHSIQDVIDGLGIIYILRHQIDESNEVENSLESIWSKSNSVSLSSNVNKITYGRYDQEVVRTYRVKINGESTTISKKDLKDLIGGPARMLAGGACYISSLRDSQKEIITSFTAIQKKDREEDVYRILKSFDNSIENVKIIGGDSIQCKVAEENGGFSYRSISEFGDGLRHYIAVIADIFKSENNYLFIDELDNGIHYSSLDQLWKVILLLSKELNVQVFVTTHSKECIESYCRVAEKLNDKDITFTTLVKNKEKAVKAIVRDFEVFTDSVHDEREVRGW